jgi:hypothetical protein
MSNNINYSSLSAYLKTYNRLSMVQALGGSSNTNRASQVAQTVADLMTKGKSAASSSALEGLTSSTTSTASQKSITYDDVIAQGKTLASTIGSIVNLFA